jgi:hypothetical protein
VKKKRKGTIRTALDEGFCLDYLNLRLRAITNMGVNPMFSMKLLDFLGKS